ncbi:MAG TPA: type II toxin-antitoxin system VapC family toxin [Burkholderiales bacterium]|nr:type II toxin-antitoxin system VapC family toxin [Burkholderiales bacterium]
MKLLLDTHVLLWWFAGESLSRRAATAIAEEGNEVYVSAASAFEISTKYALGKLDVDADVVTGLERHILNAGFRGLPVSLGHALDAGGLPPHHRDPFDRLLIAQGRMENLVVVTSDPMFKHYDVRLLTA